MKKEGKEWKKIGWMNRVHGQEAKVAEWVEEGVMNSGEGEGVEKRVEEGR